MIKELNSVGWFALLAVCFAVMSGGSGCVSPDSAGSDTRPNVLVVVIDGCRPDKFGCYGFDRPTTPAIDGLAGDREVLGVNRVDGTLITVEEIVEAVR